MTRASAQTEGAPNTIVVPASEYVFQEQILGEHRYVASAIDQRRIPSIKYLAVYRLAPISSITHVAPVKSISRYHDTNSFIIDLSGPVWELPHTSLVGRMTRPRYLSYRELSQGSNDIGAVQEVLHGLRRHGILVADADRIEAHLLRYPELGRQLSQLGTIVRGKFDPATQLSLELHRDAKSAGPHLTLYIRRDEYDERFVHTIWHVADLLSEVTAGATSESEEGDWQTSDWLEVTTDFQKPGAER